MDCSKKWLFDFNSVKTQLVLFGGSDNTGAIDAKMDGCVLEEKPSCKILGLTFSSKLDWDYKNEYAWLLVLCLLLLLNPWLIVKMLPA